MPGGVPVAVHAPALRVSTTAPDDTVEVVVSVEAAEILQKVAVVGVPILDNQSARPSLPEVPTSVMFLILMPSPLRMKKAVPPFMSTVSFSTSIPVLSTKGAVPLGSAK